MLETGSRFITFERCLNFRDLGGYAAADGKEVRRGRLYRSMTPQFMTEADVRHARGDLGIRRVLDLRDWPDTDSGLLGRPPNERQVVKFSEFAFMPETRDLSTRDALPLHLDYSAAAIAEAIRLLAADFDGATVFHCQTGKDRTGVLAVVLLRLLGVSADDAIADYMAGAEIAPAVQALINAESDVPFTPPRFALEGLDPAGITAVLDRLESEFGGAHRYLESNGVAPEALDRLIASMLV